MKAFWKKKKLPVVVAGPVLDPITGKELMPCAFCGTATNRKYCEDCRLTAAPWRVDPVNLERAYEVLGLKVSARISFTTAKNVRGRYYGMELVKDIRSIPDSEDEDEAMRSMMYHNIRIIHRLMPEDASRTIWHELTHALQYERDPEGYKENYKRECRKAIALTQSRFVSEFEAYLRIPQETEAKANEYYHDTHFPLTLANKRVTMQHKHEQAYVNGAENGHIWHGYKNKVSAKEWRAANIREIHRARSRMGPR